MDELVKFEQVRISDHVETLSEKLLAKLKLFVKSNTNELKWCYLKRLHAMVKFISKQEYLTQEDQLVARMWVFLEPKDTNSMIIHNMTDCQIHEIDYRLKQNILMEQILTDAKHLDELGTIGITKHPNFTFQQYESIFDQIKTDTAKCIGESRMKSVKEFRILQDMELAGADYYPQCNVCCKRDDDKIGFLPCHHAFCSKCFYGPYNTAHCNICDQTFYDESPHF